MRLFSSKINDGVSFAPPPIPDARLSRVTQTASAAADLLDQSVTDTFNQACLLGDLGAAADLLEIRVRWHERRAYPNEHARRTDRIALRRLQGELERRCIMKGVRLG
jgi:hypothetical protein